MAMRKQRRIMRRFRMDELSSVDSPAQKGALALLLKRDSGDGERLEKSRVTLITSVADDHAHALHVWSDDVTGGETSHASAPDEESSHGHAWALDAQTGRIVIAENRGHSHDVDASAVFEMLVAMAKGIGAYGADEEDAKKRQRRRKFAADNGSFPIEDREDLELAAQAIELAGWLPAPARAHLVKRASELGLEDLLSGLDEVPEVGYSSGSNSDPTDGGLEEMDKELQGQVEDLTKRLEKADRLNDSLLGLSPAAFGHYQSLNAAGRERFLALSKSDQDAELDTIEKANAVVYTDAKGREYRKNDDPRLVEMAKERDADAKEKDEAVAKARRSTFEKRAADELGNLAGDEETHVALLEAVDGIEDEKVRGAVTETLKSANGAMKGGFTRQGTSRSGAASKSAAVPDGDPQDEFDAIVADIRKNDPSISEAAAFDKAAQTERGAELYDVLLDQKPVQ